MSANVDTDAEVNLTPLLDLVLQLIMFFMITVNFVREGQVNEAVVLPVAQSGIALDKGSIDDSIYLNMNEQGKLVGRAEDLNSPAKLKAYLTREKEIKDREHRAAGGKGDPRVVVVLRAHQNCRYSQVWDALKSCEAAGFTRWQMRVLTKGKTEA